MRRCEACGGGEPDYNTPWCECDLCRVCLRGVVNSCPVCHIGRIVPVEPGGVGVPWQPFAILVGVAAAMLVMGWLAR